MAKKTGTGSGGLGSIQGFSLSSSSSTEWKGEVKDLVSMDRNGEGGMEKRGRESWGNDKWDRRMGWLIWSVQREDWREEMGMGLERRSKRTVVPVPPGTERHQLCSVPATGRETCSGSSAVAFGLVSVSSSICIICVCFVCQCVCDR